MLLDEIRVGAEVDAYCTRCKLVTNHRIVAMVEDQIKRVICLTCDGQHNFRPVPGAKKPRGLTAKRVRRDEKRVSSGPRQVFQKWQDMKTALDPEVPVRPYNMGEAFKEGEAMAHGKFGLGFVSKVLLGNKIEVMFETEIKTLAINYHK
jgi:hypothetical protein